MLTNESVIRNADLVNSLNRTGMIVGNKGISLDRSILLSNYTEEAITSCWGSLCTFIAQNYSSGKGTVIKGFGVFTFNNYEVNLEGTTNQFLRDIKLRNPVFIVSPEFLGSLKPGQYTKSGIIYYTQKLNNSISHVRMNPAEIAYANSMSKEECANIISNLLKHMSERIRNGTFQNKDLPGVGVLLLNNNIIGVKFNDDLVINVRAKPTKMNFFKRYSHLGMDLSTAQECSAGELIGPYSKNEEIRPETTLITKLTKSGDSYLKKYYDININQIPVHEVQNIYAKPLSQSQEEGVKFVNDRLQKSSVFSNGMKLRDMNLSKEVLQAFEFFKAILISNMKKLDKNANGKIKTSDCINILCSSNIHPSVEENLARSIVGLYSNNFQEIDYMNFIACLIKDSKMILFNNLSSTLRDNPVRVHSKRSRIISKSLLDIPNLSKYSNSTLSGDPATMRLPKIKINSLTTQKQEIDSIKKELNVIMRLLPELKIKNRTMLDQNISINEFMNILSSYSISYSKQTLIKILQFLELYNTNRFSIKELDEQLNKFVVLRTQINNHEIQMAYKKTKDIFFSKGGKEKLFEMTNDITRNEFVELIEKNSQLTTETINGLFDYLVKTNRNFTIEDYERFFDIDKPVFDENYELAAMRTINDFISKKHLRPDEYFDYLLTYNVSKNNKVLSRPDFIRILQIEKLNFSAEELNHLFGYLDTKKDEVIDKEEFLCQVNYVTQPLCELQYKMKKNNIDIEDLAHRMNIKIGVNQKLRFEPFRDKVRQLDYTLSNAFIGELFDSLKENPNDITINTDNLIEEFDIFKKEHIRSKGKTVYIKSFITHFINVVKEKMDFDTLKEALEEIDVLCTGSISKVDYCSVMDKFFKEFSDEDFIKFARITNMLDDKKNNVRYPDLLNVIYYRENEDKFTLLCDILDKYINKNYNGNIEKFLMNINKNKISTVSIEKLKEFIQSQSESTASSIPLKIYCKLDADADGMISLEDLRCSLLRYSKSSFFKYENKEDSPSINLYSSEAMKEPKFRSLVKRIKSFMKQKNINDVGLFKKLDLNNDGFISSVDFNNSIDSIIPLAPAIKDQFFTYLDHFHNGLIDQDTFCHNFKDYPDTLAKNNNTVEMQIIDDFRNFIKVNTKLSDTEIFSQMDKDSDGIISIDDFRKFVINTLLISKDDFNDHIIERVMQALSLTKNTIIGLNDIKEFINKSKSDDISKYHMNLKEVFKITTNQNLHPSKENIDWINEVIERFGMYISEKYNNILEFFEENVGKGETKFKYENFLRFHEKHGECFNRGFNLTKDELVAVFASLDSHKKNYLSIEDLESKLQVFDYYRKMHIDVKNFIKQSFYNGVDAFKFFIDTKGEIGVNEVGELNITSITKKNFFDAFECFFPRKYATDTILKYFEKNFKSNTVSFCEFNYLYFDSIASNQQFLQRKSIETKLLTSRNNLNKSHPHFRPKNNKALTPFDTDALNKLKRIIQSSRFDLKAFFEVAGLQSTNGVINKFQFRNTIKKLGVGLTNIEIDDIISKSGKMSYDGKINLKDFIKYLKGEDPIIAEGKQNISLIIAIIKDLIYKYYSNPIVCFQMNDKKITLRLDFEKFNRIIIDLYNRDRREAPNFTVLKNVYDALDLRKDGIIDLNEWTRAFGSYNGSLDLRASAVDNGFSFYSKKNKENFLNANRKVLREWESSGDICQIYKQISKHKKLIRETIRESFFNNSGAILIQNDNLMKVLKEVLPENRLTHTQWKMIVNLGKTDREDLIDLEFFFAIIEESAKKMNSHPKKFFK